MSYYTVVTFGSPASRRPAFRTDLDRAVADANEAKGSGTCSDARVYECESMALVRSADISEVRSGERIVYSA